MQLDERDGLGAACSLDELTGLADGSRYPLATSSRAASWSPRIASSLPTKTLGVGPSDHAFRLGQHRLPSGQGLGDRGRSERQCHQRHAPHGRGERVVSGGTGVRLRLLRSRCGQRGLPAHPVHVGLEKPRPRQAEHRPRRPRTPFGPCRGAPPPARASNRPACTSFSAVGQRARSAWKRGSVDDSSSLAATQRLVARPAVRAGHALAKFNSSRCGSPSGRSAAAR